jgi:hypothetical protein
MLQHVIGLGTPCGYCRVQTRGIVATVSRVVRAGRGFKTQELRRSLTTTHHPVLEGISEAMLAPPLPPSPLLDVYNANLLSPPRPLFPFPPPPPPAIYVCSSAIPDVDVLTRNVVDILEFEQIPKVCVVGHSYGSFVASRLNMAYRCGVCVWGRGEINCGAVQ